MQRFFAALIVFSVLSLVMVSPQPAAAQLVPPTRNSVNFNFATFSPTLFSLGVNYPLARVWDLTFSYAWQSTAGASASLISLGGRYHFSLQGSTINPWVGAGLGISGTSISGFGSANASGLFLNIGASVPFTPQFLGFADFTMYSIGGGTSNVIDLGVQFRIQQQFSAQIGYVSFGGSSAPFIGATYHLR